MDRKSKAKASLEGVAAADRALTLLSAFRKGDAAVSLADLAERTGLVKSTIMRLAISLEEHGYLVHLPDGSYRLDAEVLRLGTIYQQSFRLEAHVLPVLEALVARTGESAAFYIQRGEHRLCLFRADSPHLLRLHVRQGDMLPMDNSGIAQVLRAFGAVPVPAYAATLRLPVFTSGANDPHTAALAMPVFGPGERFAGALSISGPVTRLTAEAATAAGEPLWRAARDLTRALGGEPPAGPALEVLSRPPGQGPAMPAEAAAAPEPAGGRASARRRRDAG
ncbi:IclR family transcriptional regulator [Roseomonas sp. NAR14]|uniref:IclR family transcriptional regulator n=1 Tax=Roseomonas acroporae TaxID=2937791 RepID=A0A9X1YGZ2_9PROT|nr:IclR family transcriptional regulator [Roseomonas acroporae]MCK8786106.1 IclR family transcriptional regulator [Roseomonas acroporae]